MLLTLPCSPGASRLCVWSPYIDKAARRLVHDEMMKPGVFIHASVPASVWLLFFSSHLIPSQPLIITPLFNPSTLLCYPYLLFTRFPRGMWLIPHRHFVHRAKLTRKIEGRARCGSSGSRGGQRRALKHSHMLKTAQGEKKGGKYGLLHHLFVSTNFRRNKSWWSDERDWGGEKTTSVTFYLCCFSVSGL